MTRIHIEVEGPVLPHGPISDSKEAHHLRKLFKTFPRLRDVKNDARRTTFAEKR